MTPAQTPERPVTTWSDAELMQAWKASCMAQVLGLRECLRECLYALGAVHPAEVRERERETARWAADRSSPGVNGVYNADMLYGAIDKAYPSLLPKSPPPLVLSTLERVGGHVSGNLCVVPDGQQSGKAVIGLDVFTTIVKAAQEAR